MPWAADRAGYERTVLMGRNTYTLMSGMSEQAAAADSGFTEAEGDSLTGLDAVP